MMEMTKWVLDEEHPQSLMSMANLASTYWDQCQWQEAEKLQVLVMGTRKWVLGKEYPYSLTIVEHGKPGIDIPETGPVE